MSNEKSLINGLTAEIWEACYRPGMPEFAATTWVYTVESAETLRLVFGNLGPYKDDGSRTPVFTNAITIPATVAVPLAEAILKHYASPLANRPRTSGEN
jgi:hypothetical protein